MFKAAAAIRGSLNAGPSICSPSCKSMARLVLPSRLALNSIDGSSSEAPLANPQTQQLCCESAISADTLQLLDELRGPLQLPMGLCCDGGTDPGTASPATTSCRRCRTQRSRQRQGRRLYSTFAACSQPPPNEREVSLGRHHDLVSMLNIRTKTKTGSPASCRYALTPPFYLMHHLQRFTLAKRCRTIQS